MEFEEARQIISEFHYAAVLTPFVFLLLYGSWRRSYTFGTLIKRFYILMFSWIGITYLFDGCPITLIENKFAIHYWGKPFYPEYGFFDSDAFFMLTYPKMYLPLALYTVFKGVLYLSKNINN